MGDNCNIRAAMITEGFITPDVTNNLYEIDLSLFSETSHVILQLFCSVIELVRCVVTELNKYFIDKHQGNILRVGSATSI